ncbi:hypothetical protein PAMP_020092 [Pampus punctatissimus]
MGIVFEKTRPVLSQSSEMKGFGLRPQIPAAPVNCWVTAVLEGCNFCKAATFQAQRGVQNMDTGAPERRHERRRHECVFTFVWFD